MHYYFCRFRIVICTCMYVVVVILNNNYHLDLFLISFANFLPECLAYSVINDRYLYVRQERMLDETCRVLYAILVCMPQCV